MDARNILTITPRIYSKHMEEGGGVHEEYTKQVNYITG